MTVAAGTAFLTTAAALGSTPKAVASSSGGSYTATGQADGFFLTLTNSAIPLVSAVEAGGPTAQATLDSLDQSNSFASFPYPGQEEVGVPGLVGSIVGLPVPAYPAYVSGSFGQPAQDKNLAGIDLQASSTHTVSSATATVGGNGIAEARSNVVSALDNDGGVSTKATADVTGFDLGGLLTISGIHTDATATRSAAGALTTSSDLSVGEISVPGLSLTLPKTLNLCPINQLPVSGIPPIPCPPSLTSLPLPAGLAGETIAAPDIGFVNGSFTITLPELGKKQYPIPSGPILAAFKAVGLDMTFQKPKHLKNGIIAAALTITQTLPRSPVKVPPNPLLGTPGPTKIVYVFGQSSATADLSAIDGSSGTVPVIGGTGPASVGSGAALGGGALGGAPLPTDLGGASGPTAAGRSPAVAGASGGEQLSAESLPGALDAATIYLVIVGAGLLLFGATQVIRVIGVRKLWAS
ncbi:MAG TPA: hypothetical protein VHW74_02425 [Mycobacteriales bacterium]|nr:hypothetical protein [Mycobacteriales bacterium]